MILFAVHLAIALLLGYILVRTVMESRRKDLIIPIAGIATLFIIHCTTHIASCVDCSLSDPGCAAELIMFWLFAGWAIIRLWLGGDKR